MLLIFFLNKKEEEEEGRGRGGINMYFPNKVMESQMEQSTLRTSNIQAFAPPEKDAKTMGQGLIFSTCIFKIYKAVFCKLQQCVKV